jgi:NAD(P)-dependent dehydrogenase (short-subunit alcohol dehydrogenase family)
MGPYCATKWAIVALTQILAAELRPKGVVAVSLNPGVINTPMLRKYLGRTAVARAKTYQSAEQWATFAAPLILRFAGMESGRACDMPHHLEVKNCK